MKALFNSKSKWIIVVFFFTFFVLGWSIVSDYGLGFDDPLQRFHGLISVDYINSVFGLEKGKLVPGYSLETYEHKHYGVAFQILAEYLEQILGLQTFRDQFLLRHKMVFILFFLATLIFYKVVLRIYSNRWFALIAAFCFILSPRTFAHGFFNIKDSVNMSFFTFGVAALIRLFDIPNVRNSILFAFVSSLAINARLTSLVLPALGLAWILIYFLANKNKEDFIKTWYRPVLCIFAVTPLLVYLFWPSIWENPFSSFFEAFNKMSKYNWLGSVLFFNEYFLGKSVPWFYIPGWMLISIPLLYWGFFLYAIRVKPFLWIIDSIKGRLDWFLVRENRIMAMLLSFVFIPILTVIFFGSTLYDGWRQMHFIYPPFLLLAFIGFVEFRQKFMVNKKPIFKKVFYGVSGFSVAYLLAFMIIYHPYQHVYFNGLGLANTFTRFEMDYWGVSYKQGLELLLDAAPKNKCIKLYTYNFPGLINKEFLEEEKKNRFCFVESLNENPDYFMTNFSSLEQRIGYKLRKGIFSNEVGVIKVMGTPIMGVFEYNPVNR